MKTQLSQHSEIPQDERDKTRRWGPTPKSVPTSARNATSALSSSVSFRTLLAREIAQTNSGGMNSIILLRFLYGLFFCTSPSALPRG